MLQGVNFDSDMFMKLLMTELKNQNPMEPMSNTEMVSQMAQLSTVEGMNRLENTFGEMLTLARLEGGVSLIGREVEYLGPDGRAQGSVESLQATEGGLRAVVDGRPIKLEDVVRIL
jgi:flagellar basal-body rod modification protein FlgD